MKLHITRLYQVPIEDPKQTNGVAEVVDADGNIIQEFHTLELPYRDNQRRISCIPHGKYKCVKRVSQKYGHHWHVLDVENRSLILIHSGNFHTHTLGCILVGFGTKDINNNGLCDVTRSIECMNWLRANMPDEFELEITWRS